MVTGVSLAKLPLGHNELSRVYTKRPAIFRRYFKVIFLVLVLNSNFAETCPKRPVNIDLAQVQIMARCWPGHEPLTGPMAPYFTDTDVRHFTSRNMHINVVSLWLFLSIYLRVYSLHHNVLPTLQSIPLMTSGPLYPITQDSSCHHFDTASIQCLETHDHSHDQFRIVVFAWMCVCCSGGRCA